jgi:Ca2+-transporting ATPase
MLVTATGNATEYGRIASLASSAEPTSPIQEKINKLVFKIAIIVIALAAVIFVVQLIQQIPLIDSIEFTLAMIVSAVPEGLPITISIILALGAKRMAAQKALIKEMRAIESIGIVTTIASDKTGTLTANKLSLKTIWPLSASQPDFIKHIAESTLPATISTDPLDTAILGYLDHHHPTLTDIGPVHSYPFDQSLKISGNLYETTSGTLHLVIKGAPESILARCKISPENIEKVEAQINAMSSQGQKVIAIARIHQQHEINELTRLTKDDRFTFLGLISIADTLRPESAPAIKSAKKSGVSVKMITGDHSRTAFAIGKELGLATDPSQVLDCSKMGSMSDEDIVAIVKTATIFARVTPEDKFRILSAMKKSEITAMTGDGVNDVPALTNAHIGISMGDSPSIVQDASDIVLLDNNFKSIVSAIHEGRIVLTNIRRMLTYLLATNAGEAITITLALTFGHTGLLLPIQILWVNLVTDSLLVIPLGLEPAEPHFLHAKPEPKNSPILSATLIIRMIIIALTMATITLSVYLIALHLFTHEQANTLAFTALVVMQWANALSIRGLYDSILKRLSTPNLKFYIALTIAIILQILVITGPLAPLLHTAPTPPLALTIVSIVAFLIPILIVELHKFYVKITTKSR